SAHQGVIDAAEERKSGEGTRPGLRLGSWAGPGVTSSGPSAGGIGSSVLRTERRSASAGFIVAVGLIGVVVSHAGRSARANKPMMSFMMNSERSELLRP